MKRPVPLEVFSLSFIDLFSCAFGGMILLLVLFSIEQQGDTGEPLMGSVEISVFGIVDSGIIGELSVGVGSSGPHPIVLRQSGGDGRGLLGWTQVDCSSRPRDIRLAVRGSESMQHTVKCLPVVVDLERVVIAYERHMGMDGPDHVLNELRGSIKAVWSERDHEKRESILRAAMKRESDVASNYLRKLTDRDEQVDFLRARYNMLCRLQVVLSRSNPKAATRQAMDDLEASIGLLETQTRMDELPSSFGINKDSLQVDLQPIGEKGVEPAPLMRVLFDDGDILVYYFEPVSSLMQSGAITISQERDNASTP